MNITLLIIFFILGTFFGSMYTVIGQRLPKNENFIIARSHCDNCNHTLSFIDMVPILSYIFLKGRCRYCHSKIDITSTFMEFFSGVLFATAYYVFGPSYDFFIAIGIISLLMIIIVSDINYYIIPDELLIFMSIFPKLHLPFPVISSFLPNLSYSSFPRLLYKTIFSIGWLKTSAADKGENNSYT